MATDTTPAPGLTLGPLDPDGASGLTARLGTHNKASQLLKRHRANFPVALTVALARPIDEERTETLDHDEVLAALTSLKGRKAFFDEDKDELEDAAVRGTSDKDRVVSVVYRRGGEMGRSAQGVIPYAGLSASIRAYERAEEEREAKESGRSVRPAAEDGDALAAAEARAAELETAAREAEDAKRVAEERHAELLERLERLENPEPFEGYDSFNATDLIEVVSSGGVEEYGRAGLERMRAYEEGGKDRKTVLEAIEQALQSAPQG